MVRLSSPNFGKLLLRHMPRNSASMRLYHHYSTSLLNFINLFSPGVPAYDESCSLFFSRLIVQNMSSHLTKVLLDPLLSFLLLNLPCLFCSLFFFFCPRLFLVLQIVNKLTTLEAKQVYIFDFATPGCLLTQYCCYHAFGLMTLVESHGGSAGIGYYLRQARAALYELSHFRAVLPYSFCDGL
jgi:hypothetical protein